MAIPLTATTAFIAQEVGDTSGDAARVMALETLWNQAEVDKDVRALGQIVPDTFIYVDIDGSLNQGGIPGKREERTREAERDQK